jgi:uncharacterized protein (TIGR02757 family)
MRRRTGGPRDLALLGERLETLRREWRSRRLDSDPLVFAHQFRDPADREVVAFLAASLAFGRVASIQASVARILVALGPIPELAHFVHRWVTGEDVEELLRMVKRARHAHGSLGALFAAGDGDHSDYVAALSSFHGNLHALSRRTAMRSRGLRFLLPSPEGKSACKRSHLFLRWMIRTEGFDLGLWTGGRFTPARLLLPMDVHVHRISRRIGLTRRNTADLAASREATGWLRLLNPEDPVAYDWPLSRLGILSEPMTPLTGIRAHA